ncbi:MAG: hypothetical protein ACJKTH_02365 [Patescibacteria group bacterium UBA2163]
MSEEQYTGNEKDVTPANALGRLSERTQASRFTGLLIALVLVFVLALLIGLVVRGVTGKENVPEVPRVNQQ